MDDDDRSPLVSTEWLAQHADDPNIRILDVRWRSRTENGCGVGYGDLDGAAFVGKLGDLSDRTIPRRHGAPILNYPSRPASNCD